MSTRSNIIVQDETQAIQLYRHYDGYPEGVIPDLRNALKFAWKLPRFEADEFAAAIVRALKEGGGNIYIDGSADPNNLRSRLHADIDYWYHVRCVDGKVLVTCHPCGDGNVQDFIL